VRERIFSLETEYAIVHRPRKDAQPANVAAVIEAIRTAVSRRFGSDDTLFLINGSKLYHDSGHAEWSLPECRTAREAAVYDRAADRALTQAIPAANALLADAGFPGELSIIKNNVDPLGNTYGCHENYMARTETEWLDKMSHLRFSVRALLPFLVTRQILCGTGRLGWGKTGEDGFRFQISQRADFISELVSADTTKNRAIVNLGRETEPFAAGSLRRLHLILSDANLSGWATWMKLGTTGLVLRMIEDLALGDIPHLVDPVAALHLVSRDPSCRGVLPLRDGSSRTAVDVQRAYCEAAATYLGNHPASDEETRLVAEWTAALDALARDPAKLTGKADWVTKHALIGRYLARHGVDWAELSPRSPLGYEVQRLDIEYHDLSPGVGRYLQLLAQQQRADTLVEELEIRRALGEPPPYTRAQIRGALVRGRQLGFAIKVVSWDVVQVRDTRIALGDPMRFFDGRVVDAMVEPRGRLWRAAMIVHAHRALQASAAEVRIDALRALGAAPAHARLDWVIAVLAEDHDTPVRMAAADALAAIGSDEARHALTRCARAAPTRLRWHIEALLAASRLSAASDDPPAPEFIEDEPPPTATHPLVEIL